MAKETTFTVKINASDNATVILEKVAKAAQKAGDDVNKISKSMQVVSVNAFIGIAREIANLAGMGVRFLELGAKAEQTKEVFNKLSAASGVMGEKLIEDIKRASGVFVESTDAMIFAQRALAEGLKPQQIVDITEASRLFARVLGVDVKEASERVLNAIITLRMRGLKQILPMDEKKVYDDYAKALGKTGEYLSEVGKRNALVQEIMRKYQELLKTLGPMEENNAERLQKAKSAWAELKEEISQATGAVLNWIAARRHMPLPEVLGMKSKRKTPSKAIFGVEEGSEFPIPGGKGESEIDMKKYYEDLAQHNAEYQSKYFDIMGMGVESAIQKRNKAVGEALKKGMPTGPVYEYYAEVISGEKIKEGIEKGKSLGYTYQQIADAESKMVSEGDAMLANQEKQLTIVDEIRENLDAMEKQATAQQEVREARDQLETDTMTRRTDQYLSDLSFESQILEMQGRHIEALELQRQVAEASALAQNKLYDPKKLNEFYAKQKELLKISPWENLAKSISDSFSDAFLNVMNGTEKASDAFKRFGQSVLNMLSRMIMNMIFFGDLQGQKGGTSFFGTSKGGWGGILGGVLNLVGLQGGGIINRPTPAMVGESGSEAVIPLKDGKIPIEGGGNTIINNFNYITAMDALSMDDALKRNAISVLKIVNGDAKTAGTMRPLAR